MRIELAACYVGIGMDTVALGAATCLGVGM